MGVRGYRKISDKLNKSLQNIDEKLKIYYLNRSSSNNFILNDFSYSSIKEYSKSPSSLYIDSIDKLIHYITEKGMISFKRKNNMFINVLDPNIRSTNDIKINRISKKYQTNTFEFESNLNKISCLGGCVDNLITQIYIQSKITRNDMIKILNNKDVDDKVKDKLSNVYNLNIPNVDLIQNKKLLKLTIERYNVLKFLSTVMRKSIMVKILSICALTMCFDATLLPIYKIYKGISLDVNINKDYTCDDIPKDLDKTLYDLHSLKCIFGIKGKNKIKSIVKSILDKRDEIIKHDYSRDLWIYSDGIEADWIIISLSHVFMFTKVYSKDSDILLLGQCDIYGIFNNYNDKVLLRLLSGMCKTNNDKNDLINICISLFSTGCDYINYDKHGPSSFILQYKKIITQTKLIHTKINIKDVLNYFYKNCDKYDSSISFIYDSIIAIVECLSFYFEGDDICECDECIKLNGPGCGI